MQRQVLRGACQNLGANGVTYSGMLGYRALSVNYDSEGSGFKKYEFDAVLHGPVLGVSVKF